MWSPVIGTCTDISNGLSWNSHIDRITGNANHTVVFLRRNIKQNYARWERLLLTLLYGPSWSMQPHMGPLHQKQDTPDREDREDPKRAACWTSSDYDTRSSITAMLDRLCWRLLKHRQADARICLFCALSMDLWQSACQIISSPVPMCLVIATPWTFIKSTLQGTFILPLAIVQWNALPKSVVCLLTLEAFKE